jgi:hypothetical protein
MGNINMQNNSNRKFSGSPSCMRGFAVAIIFLAGIATRMLSAQGGGGRFTGPRLSGVVTAVTTSSVSIKTEAGLSYTVTAGADARLMRRGDSGPEQIALSDIKVGDVVTAGGTQDDTAHTVDAQFLIDVTGDQAAALVANEANIGKTWVAGKVTAISGTSLTILRNDGTSQTITADDSTSFTRAPQRGGGGAPTGDSITLADVKVGDNVSAKGALKGDTFVPATVVVGGMGAGYGGQTGGMGGGRPASPPPQ